MVKSAIKSISSLHQLLQAEKCSAIDSPVTCSDLDSFQKGLGQAWVDAIAPNEDHKLSRRFDWMRARCDASWRVNQSRKKQQFLNPGGMN